jgi:aminopeptidase N
MVREVEVNGEKVHPSAVKFEKHRVHLPSSLLNSQMVNRVSFKFYNTYVNNSAGFHKFTDPVDGEVYLYTHLEPFYCHRWFPCFDQPDLRAQTTLHVISPDLKWQVIGNSPQESSGSVAENQDWISEANVSDFVKA